MNILFLEGDMSRKGGTERMTAQLSGLMTYNHRVHILSLHQGREKLFYQLAPSVHHQFLTVSNIAKQITVIHQYIRKHHIDCVINVDTGMGYYGILAAVNTRAKVITWEHSNYFNNWDSKLFSYLRKFAARYSDAMVVLTETDKTNYISHVRKCVPVTVIPNPLKKEIFAYDLTSKSILSAGIFNSIKRFDLIPEIGRSIFPKHPDWRWIICGEGTTWGSVKDQIHKYGLEDNIILPGTISDMTEEYRHTSIYVMTSKMEGLPMVLLEAKSYGLPIVSFDIMTGPADIIKDGINGYLIPDGNLGEMVNKILTLIEQPELRQRFSAVSQLDMEKFSMESVVEKWEALIKNLCGKKSYFS